MPGGYLAAPDAAAIRHRRIGVGGRAHRVGHEVADRGFARAHGGGAAVERYGGGAQRVIELLAELSLVSRNDCRYLGIGRHRRRIDDAKLRPPGHAAAAALLLDVDGDVDCGDVVGVVARFRHRVAAVEFDEEIVIVTAEHEIDRACLENRVVLLAAGMDHRHDEISPFTSQRLGCILRGRDRR